MKNEKKSDLNRGSSIRFFFIRGGVILLLFLLTFSFFYSALAGLFSRVAITGIEDFPSVWRDWFMLAAAFLSLFLIHMGFTGIMHNLNLSLRKWPREV